METDEPDPGSPMTPSRGHGGTVVPTTPNRGQSSIIAPTTPGSRGPLPSTAAAALPRVVPLHGLVNFDEWEASLRAALRYHGLAGFLEEGAEPRPAHADSVAFRQWDERRKVAKGIIKCSIEPVMGQLRQAGEEAKHLSLGGKSDGEGGHGLGGDDGYTTGEASAPGFRGTSAAVGTHSSSSSTTTAWKPTSKHPRHHFDAAVALVVRTAESQGVVAQLVQKLCRADRAECESLAAYQQLLTDARRRLARLHNAPGDKFLVWVAINGLRSSHPRWHQRLVADAAAELLGGWDGLMEQMAVKACREKPGGGKHPHDRMDDTDGE